MVPLVFIWTAARSALVRWIFSDSDLRRFVAGCPAVFLNHFPGGFRIFLAHQNDGPAHARKDILLRVQRSHIGINTGGFEQAANHQRLRFLFGVEHPDKLFIRIWVGGITLFHWLLRVGRLLRDTKLRSSDSTSIREQATPLGVTQ